MKVKDLFSRPSSPRTADPRSPFAPVFADLNSFPVQPSDPVPEPAPPTVQFARSGTAIAWDDRYESLLDLADDHGIEISAGCRYGDCGTCSTALLEGTVSYNHRTGIVPDDGYCLPCSCRPSTSVVLDI